jgi:hypothetical protein
VSKDQFRGYHFQQLNHQRLSLSMAGMGAIESGVLLRLHVLFGLTRQQFGLNDGRLSLDGKPMKVDELARWLSCNTPQLSAARARKALETLCKEHKQIGISAAGVVKLGLLAGEQKDAPSADASRKRRSRAARQVERAVLSLYKVRGQVLEADVVLYRVQAAANVGPAVAERVMKQLIADGVLVPADGGLLVSGSETTAPSALPPPPVSDGPAGVSDEVTCAHPDGCDMSQSLDHIRSYERDANASHDHDARAARGCEVPPEPAVAAPGPGHRDGFADEKRGGEAAPKARFGLPAASGIDAIYACHWRHLAPTAVRLLGSSSPEKSRSILESKLRMLCEHSGPECARDEFRQLVHAIHTEMSCPGGGRLREPCMELTARLNETMGRSRRSAKKQEGVR